MAFITLQPTANQTPYLGRTLAVNFPTNTGHGNTSANANCTAIDFPNTCNSDQDKTCRWFGFTGSFANIKSITLKGTFDRNGSVSISSVNFPSVFASASSHLNYSTDGGTIWNGLAQSAVNLFSGGFESYSPATLNFSIVLPVNQVIGNVQLYSEFFAQVSVDTTVGGPGASGNASGEGQGTVSNLRLEIETFDPQSPIVMM